MTLLSFSIAVCGMFLLILAQPSSTITCNWFQQFGPAPSSNTVQCNTYCYSYTVKEPTGKYYIRHEGGCHVDGKGPCETMPPSGDALYKYNVNLTDGKDSIVILHCCRGNNCNGKDFLQWEPVPRAP